MLGRVVALINLGTNCNTDRICLYFPVLPSKFDSDSRFKKLYCPFKNKLKTEIFLQSHIK